jgi:hypothetical protein
MDIRPLSKSIRRVTVFEGDGSGGLRPRTVYKGGRKRKRQTRGLKPLERIVRIAANAGDAFSGTYRRRHRRSNEKRKDGWLRDSAANLAKAGDRARKKLDLVRLLGW